MNAYKLDLYSKLLSIAANMLVLGAVTLSMYMASFSPETHLSAFCTWFFSLLVPILGAAWYAKRTLRHRYDGTPHAHAPSSGPRGCTASNGLTGVRLMEKATN